MQVSRRRLYSVALKNALAKMSEDEEISQDGRFFDSATSDLAPFNIFFMGNFCSSASHRYPSKNERTVVTR